MRLSLTMCGIIADDSTVMLGFSFSLLCFCVKVFSGTFFEERYLPFFSVWFPILPKIRALGRNMIMNRPKIDGTGNGWIVIVIRTWPILAYRSK